LGGVERLTGEQEALERVYVGLRTTQGIAVLPDERALLDRWIAAEWGTVVDARLELTPLGWLRLDALVTALTEHRSR
jgi:hypothetical protein